MINNIAIIPGETYFIPELFPNANVICKYMPLDYHRNGNPGKSQWNICIDEELDLFLMSQMENWHDSQRGWWIDPTGNNRIIGKTKMNEDVYIVRYQGKCSDGQPQNSIWHGYPADIKRKNNDIPSDIVLNDWLTKNLINHHQFTHIRRGIA